MKKVILAISLVLVSIAGFAGSIVNAEVVKGVSKTQWTSASKTDFSGVNSSANAPVYVKVTVSKVFGTASGLSGIFLIGCDNNQSMLFVPAGWTQPCHVGYYDNNMNFHAGTLKWASQENGAVKNAAGTYSVK